MHHVWDGLGCVEHIPGSGVHTEVEVRLSNRKAVGSGCDGFEGKEGPGNFFGFLDARMDHVFAPAVFLFLSLPPTTLFFESTYPLASRSLSSYRHPKTKPQI